MLSEVDEWVRDAKDHRQRREKWEAMTTHDRNMHMMMSGPPMGPIGLNPDCVYPVIEEMWDMIQRLTEERDSLQFWMDAP